MNFIHKLYLSFAIGTSTFINVYVFIFAMQVLIRLSSIVEH